ncbi:MAG: S8 family serine peptidase, partial [Gemmatimonadales bacterium]
VLSGTSMASPHAAGVAALVLSRNPALTPDQLRAVLRTSAVDLGAPGWDPLFGYGRVNARAAVEQTPEEKGRRGTA